MHNPVVSWLFETDAVRVCPEGQPFWYTSGKLGPFYINTQFLFGSEQAALELLAVIEEACAGDRLAFYDKVWARIDAQLASCPIYAQLIDDTKGITLVSASTLDPAIRGQLDELDKKGAAKLVGKTIAERALQAGYKTVVFDRGGYVYTGRVQAVADGAREAGLEF